MNNNLIKNKRIHVGVIGFGRMGLMHAAIFNSLPESKLVAVMDPSQFPSKHLGILNTKIKVFDDLEKMLENVELDLVLIASPVSSHIPIAIKCVDNNLPFIIEKPLSLNAHEAVPLLKKLEENPIPNMIGYMYRFMDSFKQGRKILKSNCLGNIQRVNANIYISQLFQKGKGWRYNPKESGGGSLINNGSHLIDLITWYFGSVLCVNSNILDYYCSGIDDFAHLIIKHDSGITTIFDCSWSVRFKRKIDIKIDILGDNGSLIITDDSIQLFLDRAHDGWPAGKTFLDANDLYTPVVVDIGSPKFTVQSQYLLHAIKSGQKPSPDVLQGFHVQQIIDAAYQSSEENGAPIKII